MWTKASVFRSGSRHLDRFSPNVSRESEAKEGRVARRLYSVCKLLFELQVVVEEYELGDRGRDSLPRHFGASRADADSIWIGSAQERTPLQARPALQWCVSAHFSSRLLLTRGICKNTATTNTSTRAHRQPNPAAAICDPEYGGGVWSRGDVETDCRRRSGTSGTVIPSTSYSSWTGFAAIACGTHAVLIGALRDRNWCWHFGHLIFLPSISPSIKPRLWQFGQMTGMGMAVLDLNRVPLVPVPDAY